MSEYCKAPEKEQGLLILMMDKRWYSKLKVTIIRQLLNLIKEQQPVSVVKNGLPVPPAIIATFPLLMASIAFHLL